MQAGQQAHARLAAWIAARDFGATSGLGVTGGLTAGDFAAGAFGSTLGTQAVQQAHARRTARVAARGFGTTGGLDHFATTTRVRHTATEQTGLRTRSADQTEQADRQQGGDKHTTLHWEGSSIQKHV